MSVVLTRLDCSTTRIARFVTSLTFLLHYVQVSSVRFHPSNMAVRSTKLRDPIFTLLLVEVHPDFPTNPLTYRRNCKDFFHNWKFKFIHPSRKATCIYLPVTVYWSACRVNYSSYATISSSRGVYKRQILPPNLDPWKGGCRRCMEELKKLAFWSLH